MANYAQTVNVIGAIKTTKTEAEIEATGLVLALYRREFGTLPLHVSGDVAPLDVAAALTPDRTTITVAVVNPTAETRSVKVDVQGARTGRGGQRFVLTGSGRWAYNAPGRTRGVTVEQRSIAEDSASVVAPPSSVALYRLPLE
jgi:alpha-N-arabinofuranosidase